ncbi:hypothetical protein WA026_000438 [Henosepilachna vigintioctopunctata]|uniref:(3R)-3-hydroxyacyl-CoA dehydrogenase n=1 Tax=Henosepilachna vigintioctopunctata TaxID=420089 RepID=A0AAW1UYH2_9CUCU
MSLIGRTAFVTGAGSGIGRATCQVLARDGANIIAADVNEANARKTIELIDKSESKNLSIAIDVSKSSNVKHVLDKVLETYKKPPSIIVNCAGITRDNFILKLSEENFQEVIDVNLKGTFLVLQAFANAIIEHQISPASIINIGSVSSKNGNMGQANYCASKAGVELLTKTAAKEFGKVGIRVNAVLPGFISTPMTAIVPEKVKAILLKQIPLARLGNPEEIAEVISFLASEKSSYINGASINVNGGMV